MSGSGVVLISGVELNLNYKTYQFACELYIRSARDGHSTLLKPAAAAAGSDGSSNKKEQPPAAENDDDDFADVAATSFIIEPLRCEGDPCVQNPFRFLETDDAAAVVPFRLHKRPEAELELLLLITKMFAGEEREDIEQKEYTLKFTVPMDLGQRRFVGQVFGQIGTVNFTAEAMNAAAWGARMERSQDTKDKQLEQPKKPEEEEEEEGEERGEQREGKANGEQQQQQQQQVQDLGESPRPQNQQPKREGSPGNADDVPSSREGSSSSTQQRLDSSAGDNDSSNFTPASERSPTMSPAELKAFAEAGGGDGGGGESSTGCGSDVSVASEMNRAASGYFAALQTRLAETAASPSPPAVARRSSALHAAAGVDDEPDEDRVAPFFKRLAASGQGDVAIGDEPGDDADEEGLFNHSVSDATKSVGGTTAGAAQLSREESPHHSDDDASDIKNANASKSSLSSSSKPSPSPRASAAAPSSPIRGASQARTVSRIPKKNFSSKANKF